MQLITAESLTESQPSPKPKKKLVRRVGVDNSQFLRQLVQAAFLALNVILGVQFYLWVRFYETAGRTVYAARPAGVDGWLPIAGLMSLKAAIETGTIPGFHPAGMFLFAAFLGIAFLFRKAFCSWLCPVGTISEYLWKLGRAVFHRNFHLPRWADISLRSLKYLLLGFFLYSVVSMDARGLLQFLQSPYALIADVKMLNFFRYLGTTGMVVLAVLGILSVLVQNFWCRYLCPYGALMGLVSLASPVRIRREAAPCIDCAKCAKACPSNIPVDRLITVKTAECTGCMACVASCPAEGALFVSAPKRKQVPLWAFAAGIVVLFLGTVGYAKLTGHWESNIPQQVYFELIPNVDATTHTLPLD